MGWLLPALLLTVYARGEVGPVQTGSVGEPVRTADPGRLASAEVFVTGAAMTGTNGMQFGADGYLYVASVMGSEIVVLDPQDGSVRRRMTAADGIDGPDDLAFGPDGAMFWTSIFTGEVAGFDAAGKRVVAGNPGPGVNPIAFSPDGRLFVAQCFFAAGIFELDPRGVAPPRRIAADLGPECGLNGMDWGRDGRLYGGRWFRGEVVSLDVDSGEVRVEAAGLQVPAAVKFDRRGRLHAVDTGTGQVLRMDAGGPVVVARLSPGLDNFAFDLHNRLFVSSFTDGFIVRIDPDGTVVELLPGGMVQPGGVAILPPRAAGPAQKESAAGPAQKESAAGPAQVVVADVNALRGYDAVTGEPTFVERNIPGAGTIGGMREVAADGGNLILTSFTDNSVRVWNPVERRVVERYDNLAQPVSALRYRSEVVVAEHGSKRVVALTNGPPRVLAEGLPAPTGLATDGVSLFVSDRERGEILEIARDGLAVPPRRVVGGLAAPEGIALHGHDLIVVEGQTGRVLQVRDGVATTVAQVAPGTAGTSPTQPPSMVLNDVAVLGDVLYVTGETNRVLYRIDLGGAAPAARPATNEPGSEQGAQ